VSPVLVTVIVDSSRRSSMISNRGRDDLIRDRLESPRRRDKQSEFIEIPLI
jgi:hypothetical protein